MDRYIWVCLTESFITDYYHISRYEKEGKEG